MKDLSRSRASQAESMSTGHQAAAYDRWLAAEIQGALDDSRSSLPLDEVMAAMDAEIDAVAREPAADCSLAQRLVPSVARHRQ